MKQLRFLFLITVLFSASQTNYVQAQLTKTCNLCFRGKPSSECCSFLIFEAGFFGGAMRSGQPPGKANFLFIFNMGVMINNSHSSAFGGSIHISADDNGSRFGLGPRYRKWLGPKTALDITPILMFGGDDNQIHRRFPGFALSASLSLSDLISFDSYFQIIRYETVVYDYSTPQFPPPPTLVRDSETGLYLGISGRSFLASVIPVALGLLVAATWD